MVGLVNAISHSLCEECQLPHEEAVGIMLPHVMRWQLDVVGPEYGRLLCDFCGPEYYAQIPDRQRGEKLIEAIEDTLIHLHQKCEIPSNLREAGVARKDFRAVAQAAMDDGALLTNPKPAKKEDVMDILEQAL